ncbi:MAG: InlB B-repeat-containing protein [Corallococcus sp.]|nr:InlB B-repeat-containing protein [Corallococcus sp.]
MTKRKICILFAVLVLAVSLVAVTACQDPQPTDNYWTVTFYVSGSKYGEEVKVLKGRRITAASIPADPTFGDGSVFIGWYTSATEFSDANKWDFEKGKVTQNLDLYAGYRVISAEPTDLQMAQEACTSKLVWTQRVMGTDYTVSLGGGRNA